MAVSFGPAHGLPEIGFTSNSTARGPDGTLYFGGAGGITAFQPAHAAQDLPPKTVLTGLSVFNTRVNPGPDAPIDRPIHRARSITITPDQNDFTLEFSGLDFRNPEQIQYQYRLDPHDARWVDAGTQRMALYAEIDPGTYTFRVRAANKYGIWSTDETSIQVRVLPPWWRTWWAYSKYGLLFLGSVVGIDRLQRRRLVRRERERARIEQAELRTRVLEAENQQKELELEKARELEQAYNQLKTTQQQLVQAEKMASLGQLTSGIAHELKNPLNFVNNFARLCEELSRELIDELVHHSEKKVGDVKEVFEDLAHGLKANASQVVKHGTRADRIVENMMEHASAESNERYRVELNAFTDQYIDLAYQGKKAQHPDLEVQIQREYDDTVGTVEIATREMGRVLLNLLGNAFDAVREKASTANGAYAPRITVKTRKTDGQAEVQISDNGPGVPAALQAKIFEPFFTTKPTGTGTGLGLSLSYDIVTQRHGGALTMQSEEGEGATFVVTLPFFEHNPI